MARRPGLRTVSLEEVRSRLHAERAGCEDLYEPLKHLRVVVNHATAPAAERYLLALETKRRTYELRPSETALAQLCQLSGVPYAFLERVPPALGLKAMRGMLAIAAESDERPHLFRLKAAPRPVLRALLPQSYVRLDDVDVVTALQDAARTADLRAVNVSIDDDVCALRLVSTEKLELGTQQHSDPALPGIDVVSSETGRHALEVRNVLVRVVCLNGVTSTADARQRLRKRYTDLGRDRLWAAFREAIDNAPTRGKEMALRLSTTRDQFAEDPPREVGRICERFRLGTSRGRIARWVVAELLQHATLFGVRRFDVVQAFTAVARGLEPAERRRVEDAMGEYVVEGVESGARPRASAGSRR